MKAIKHISRAGVIAAVVMTVNAAQAPAESLKGTNAGTARPQPKVHFKLSVSQEAVGDSLPRLSRQRNVDQITIANRAAVDLSDIATLEPEARFQLPGPQQKAFVNTNQTSGSASQTSGSASQTSGSASQAHSPPKLGNQTPRIQGPGMQVAIAGSGKRSGPARENLGARPHSYLEEYNVDWSGWISAMTSRWLANLKLLEAQVNTQFITDRPALIQFTCYPSGQIGNIALRQSSGVDTYDRLQMLALSQVVPLPPFPAGTKCSTITLVTGWESHAKRPGESEFDPIKFGRGFPMEKVEQWVRPR
ncbi:MAG TPA: TonB C-terminal domain-containing protein [Candidatus Obscuribacterales bacterium]